MGVTLDTETVAAQVDPLIARVQAGTVPRESVGEIFRGSDAEIRGLFTRMLAVIERLTPAGSTYRQQAEDVRNLKVHMSVSILSLVGVLEAIRDDYAAGYLRSIEELIHADVFADFLEMANELHGKGYKDPAAVITGSVLEEHVRKLATAHQVAVESAGRPRKADTINADLAKAGGYNKLEQKQITAWLDLRNKAAHGEYEQYEAGQVAALIRDVRDFMVRHPA